MTVAVCISDGGGMLFNKRRQSKDKAVIADILKQVEGKKILISNFSLPLFFDHKTHVDAVSNPLALAANDSFVFVEDQGISEHKQKITELLIYKWNRKYPYDFKLDIDPEMEGMYLSEIVEFEGNSHEKITRERWKHE